MMVIGRVSSARTRHAIERMWARAASRVLGLRLRVRGLEHVDPRRRYLIVALHEGLADPLVLWHLPLPLRFVGRDEFLDWPVIGPYLRATGQLMVPNQVGPSARRILRGAARAVARGESIVVFPHGSVLGIEVGFRPGATRLASLLELPLLPVVITGTHRVWEHPYSPRLRLEQPVSVTVLPPIDVDGLGRVELERFTTRLEVAMKAMALGAGHVPPRRYVPTRDGTWDAYDFVIDPSFGEVAAQLPHRVGRRAAHGTSGTADGDGPPSRNRSRATATRDGR